MVDISISTAQDYITKAFVKIGVGAMGEPLTAQMLSDALDSLNAMLDSWSGRSLLTSAQIRESFPLVAFQTTYTIGIGGTFNTTKPFEIASAFIRDLNGLDYPVDPVSRGLYDGYGDKALTPITSAAARPRVLFYDPGMTQQANQLGTIYMYPVPDATSPYTLFLESEKPWTEFASLSTAVTFPPAYNRAIIYNLALELLTEYPHEVSPTLAYIAKEAMRIVEQVNSKNKKGVMGMSLPGVKGSLYDVYSDESA